MRGGRVIGYHGTSSTAADEILKVGFRSSENKYDWLGKGTYFFEEDDARALAWAKGQHGSNGVVLGAVIELSDVLDLTQFSVLETLRQAAVALEKSYEEAGEPLPVNKGKRHDFDAALIDFFCEQSARVGASFSVVRGMFEEGERIHPSSSLLHLTHVQLAIRDARAILGVWPLNR